MAGVFSKNTQTGMLLALIVCLLGSMIVALYHTLSRMQSEIDSLYDIAQQMNTSTHDTFDQISTSTADELERLAETLDGEIQELAGIVFRMHHGEENN